MSLLAVIFPMAVCENNTHLLVFSWFHVTRIVLGYLLWSGVIFSCKVLQIVLTDNENYLHIYLASSFDETSRNTANIFLSSSM